jgi:hypothetical protein
MPFLLLFSYLLLCPAESLGAVTATSDASHRSNVNKFPPNSATKGSSALLSNAASVQEIFCTSNATCPPDEYCFDYIKSSWFVPCSPDRDKYCFDARTSLPAKPGTEGTGVCFGKKCIATNTDPEYFCRGFQNCVHRIIEAGILGPSAPRMMAKTGRCLDPRTCGPQFFPDCPNGWTCIRGHFHVIGLGFYCAPESFPWDFGKCSFLRYRGFKN